MNVYYPHGGRRFLLHWWTYNERGHVILAPSEKSLEASAKAVFRKHSDMEIRAYLDVEIVAPPAHFDVLRAKYARRESISGFKHEVFWRLHEVLKAKRPLPPPFTRCPRKGEHYDCKGCTLGVRTDLSDEELFDRYAATWPFQDRRKHPADPKHVPSRARVPEEGEVLSYAYADFGHHSNGLVLAEAVLPEADPEPAYLRPVILSDRVLFFYRVHGTCDAAPLQTLFDAAKAKAKALSEQRENERKAKYEREQRELIDNVLAFFNGPPV